MLKVIFYLKTASTKANGECPIFAKVSNGAQQTVFSISKSISLERWNATNHLRNFLKLEKEKVLKNTVDTIQSQIEKVYSTQLKENGSVNLNDLKLLLLGKTPTVLTIDILKVFEIHNAYFLKKVKAGERSAASYQKYERSKDLVAAFLQKTYKTTLFEVCNINSSFVYNLETYLKYDTCYKGKTGIQNNSVVKYFKNFKTMCNYGIKMDLFDKNPFAKYDGKLHVKDATFLSQDELDRISNKKFKIERLEKVKNIFLFSCYTGYAPIDAAGLTERNLILNSDGDVWIKANRAKTGTRANVPVLPQAQAIIEKYRGQQLGLIPKMSNQKMNAYLKEIAELCDIEINLTYYVARHTFATTITLGNGVKIENVSAMMGHSSIKQTQHYAKVLDNNVMDDMKKLMLKFK